ncbi:MAG: hypothetical protein L3K15_00180 [Thermoplasmata archaeon]|nr:hypothetical protein [Thermoplasmata archaeon]
MDFSTLTNVAFGGIALLGVVLLGLGLLALRRAPSPRLGLAAAAFALVAVEGTLVGYGLIVGGWDAVTLLFLTAVFEAVALVVLFVATLVR